MNSVILYLNEIYYLLGEDKKRIPFLMIIFLTSSFFDVVSIALLIPYISLILNDPSSDFMSSMPLFIRELILNKDFVFNYLGALIILSFAAKLLITAYTIYIINSFAFQRTKQLKNDLVVKFFNLSYKFIINKKSSEYVNSTNVLTHIYAGSISIVLKAISDGIIVLGIIITILFISPFILVSLISIFAIIALVYFIFFQKRIASFGEKAVLANETFIKTIIENFRGFKQIKIFGLQDYFILRSDTQAGIYAKNSTLAAVFTGIPRPLFELIIVAMLVLSIFFITSYDQNVQSFLPIFTAFVYLGIRLLPFMSSSIQTVLHLRFHRKAISLLYNELQSSTIQETNKNQKNTEKFKNLEANNVEFSYESDPDKKIHIKNISIDSGDTVAIAGRSGSGKTTVANILLGFLSPQKGSIKYNGKNIEQFKQYFRSQISYLPQDPFFIDDTLIGNICLGVKAKNINYEKLNEAIKLSGLVNFVDSLPKGIESEIGENGSKLSGGQAQRLSLARLFYFDRPLILLDEATSALDYETEKYIYKSLESLKGLKTTIIISHKSNLLNLCNKVFSFKNGILSKD